MFLPPARRSRARVSGSERYAEHEVDMYGSKCQLPHPFKPLNHLD
jgi:hypothetical protein